MIEIDLTLLRVGAKVRLRGDAKPQPRKPYPRGWQEVVETAPAEKNKHGKVPQMFRVTSDDRWLLVDLIEEIVL